LNASRKTPAACNAKGKEEKREKSSSAREARLFGHVRFDEKKGQRCVHLPRKEKGRAPTEKGSGSPYEKRMKLGFLRGKRERGKPPERPAIIFYIEGIG